MTPIIAVFMSMISLLALVADRANLQEQGEAIPLPSVDDGVSRNFLDVAKRTLPLKMTPARSITLRRVPRAASTSASTSVYRLRSSVAPSASAGPGFGEVSADTILLQSLLLSALSERHARLQQPPAAAAAAPPAPGAPDRRTRPGTTPQPHDNSLGDLKEDIMVHGRDRDQLRRRWKIENAGNRVASVSGHRPRPGQAGAGAAVLRALPVKRRP